MMPKWLLKTAPLIFQILGGGPFWYHLGHLLNRLGHQNGAKEYEDDPAGDAKIGPQNGTAEWAKLKLPYRPQPHFASRW